VELSTIESENFEDSKNEELEALEEIENEKARLNFASISLDSEKLKLEEKKREVAELVEKVKRQSEQLNEKQSALTKSKELEKKQR
jgi:predicted  nucleic acid-binding Zn-ribbon protein